ncbi:aminoglycoside phosphotransferase family protein [Hyphomicrobium sp.]|uniref:aminoglycoside phosphotransferase family protein n=1 Tax=Hyphomicrobium sp. TaxID=82 RepID=UPI003F700151
MFDPYLTRWSLVADGDDIVTRAARLLPVRQADEAAMLRIVTNPEAKGGDVLLTWWDGEGAVRVLEVDGDALLLERAEGRRSLTAMARSGQDDEATQIICDVIAELHAPRAKPLPDLIPLLDWFAALWPAAEAYGGLLAQSAEAARRLLAGQREVGALHGDIHHDNILDFGPERGWLAIDPNRLCGDRGFDYANLFCNPDIADPSVPVAVLAERFRRRVEIVVERADLERDRLLSWILAYSGLSAAWLLGDGDDASVDFQIATLAATELAR